MATYTTTKKQTIETNSELGKGGEGSVYSLQRNTIQVAKIYHLSHRKTEKEQKLRAMIKNPPSDNTRKQSHISIAWPEELLYENGKFAGYLMPKIVTSPEIFEVFSPVTRKKKYPDFDWRYAHRAAQNLAISFNALHARGYVIGDVNQKNVLVTNKAMISLVDTDSFQVTDTNGRVYRCPVGVSEYTPPELQGVSLETVNRFKYHDNFGLAVLIFQLLMDGNHPFMGVPQNLQQSFGKVDAYCIKQGIFPYQSNRGFLPPPHAPRFEALHPDVQRLFLHTFVDGFKTPTSRTDALNWVNALETSENGLVQCKKNPAHWYSSHLTKCHWCEREKPSSVAPAQKPLSPSKPVTPRTSSPPIQAYGSPTKSSTPILAITGGMGLVVFILVLVCLIGGIVWQSGQRVKIISTKRISCTDVSYGDNPADLPWSEDSPVNNNCLVFSVQNNTDQTIFLVRESDSRYPLYNYFDEPMCGQTQIAQEPHSERSYTCRINGDHNAIKLYVESPRMVKYGVIQATY